MGAVRTRATAAGNRVVVVAAGAPDDARYGVRRNQAGHIRVLTHIFDRMIRRVRGVELQAGIHPRVLTIHIRFARGSVRVTAKAKFIFVIDWIDFRAAGIDSLD